MAGYDPRREAAKSRSAHNAERIAELVKRVRSGEALPFHINAGATGTNSEGSIRKVFDAPDLRTSSIPIEGETLNNWRE